MNAATPPPSDVPFPADATSNGAHMSEFEAGNRGRLSGRNAEQASAIGQDDPIAEGSRQGRERYRNMPDAPTGGPATPDPV